MSSYEASSFDAMDALENMVVAHSKMTSFTVASIGVMNEP